MKNTKYNYKNFKAEDYDFNNFIGPKPGEKYIDFNATKLDGTMITLSQYLDKPVVLETGSITCPMYANSRSGMNELMENFRNVHFLLLYVREAHPGERTEGIHSMQEKLSNAKSTCTLHKEKREIIVDSLDGNAHLLYGGMPNMTYVIDTNGIVLFRANWTNVNALEEVLNNLGKIVTKDRYAVVKPPLGIAIRTLLIGGFRALFEFFINLPQLIKQHKQAGSL